MSNPIKVKDAVRELWSRGVLSYKLHATQKKMLADYLTLDEKITVISCSRRLGKSWLLCVLAIEQCLKKPNAIVKYVCPTKRMVRDTIQPIMTDLFQDCPPELKAEYRANDYTYVFPNGSRIQMAGTDNGHHETLRGSRSDFWIIDEAGFCDKLKYVVRSVLAPTGLTTGARGVLASTPSVEPDHDFITAFFLPYQEAGKLILYTIYDNPLLSKESIQETIDSYPGGKHDSEFLREYMCQIAKSPDVMVFPEMGDELKTKIVREWEKPPFYDAYVAMDIGGVDLTCVLFAYYDFKHNKVIIEDELVFTGENFRNDIFAESIVKKEHLLWTHKLSGEFKPPYMRVADNNNVILLNDLTYKYNLPFVPTRKDDKKAAINNARVKLAAEQILISPKCKTLLYHLDNARWAKNKKDFARVGGENGKPGHHYDMADAFIYLIRNIVESKNPYPRGYNGPGRADYFEPLKNKVNTPSDSAWLKILQGRRK